MPFVNIQMIEGRTKEQKKALCEDIVKAVMKNTGAPKEAVSVVIQDLKRVNLAANGEYLGE